VRHFLFAVRLAPANPQHLTIRVGTVCVRVCSMAERAVCVFCSAAQSRKSMLAGDEEEEKLELASALLAKHRELDSLSTLTASVLEIRGLVPRKGATPTTPQTDGSLRPSSAAVVALGVRRTDPSGHHQPRSRHSVSDGADVTAGCKNSSISPPSSAPACLVLGDKMPAFATGGREVRLACWPTPRCWRVRQACSTRCCPTKRQTPWWSWKSRGGRRTASALGTRCR
jgi:hypothetical protein